MTLSVTTFSTHFFHVSHIILNTVYRYIYEIAMYGYSPPTVESKLLYYMVYYSSVIELEFDPKTTHPIQASHNDKLTTGKQFLGSYFLLSIFYSILEPCSYALFDSPIERDSHGQQLTVLDFIHPGHLANNFIVACTYPLNIDAFRFFFKTSNHLKQNGCRSLFLNHI
jgi:hypothetical protein